MMSVLSLKKPKRLVDEVREDPIKVIDTVFDELDISYFISSRKKWLRASISLKRKPYDERQGQLALVLFHDKVQFLIQSLYFIHLANEQNDHLIDEFKSVKKDKIVIEASSSCASYSMLPHLQYTIG